MGKSKIEWTDETWNPVTGCMKVSQGCKNCYAETIAERFWAKQYPPNEDGTPRRFTDVRLHPERLEDPLRWKKPRMVFVNSMSDLFHSAIPDSYVDEIFGVMRRAYWHTFQILTKRASYMYGYISRRYRKGQTAILPNVWLGVSVEDQKTADERIPLLLDTPAAVRFLSCEPLLGSVDLLRYLVEELPVFYNNKATGFLDDTGEVRKRRLIHWVIVGGESGPHARPMHPDWARSIRDQCLAAGVPYFFKQWGEWLPITPQYPEDDGDSNLDDLDMNAHTICFGNKRTLFREDRGLKEEYWCGYQPDPAENPWFFEKIGKKAAGRLLDGREWNEFPETAKAATPEVE